MTRIASTPSLRESLDDDYYFQSPVGLDYRECTFCVMDTTATDISFDEDGVCSFCRDAKDRYARVCRLRSEGKSDFGNLVSRIRCSSRSNRYDCVVGLSGGVDSSYTAYLLKRAGIRPLAVHLDNGWNSELAVENIQLLVQRLGIDLLTHVIDWEEFRDLQRSFFRASVVDVEMLTDHAIAACLHRQAVKWRLRDIVSGSNTATESIMPKLWNHCKLDARNIRGIHRKYGRSRPKTYPWLSFTQRQWLRSFRRVRGIRLLDYVDYNKQEAEDALADELGWCPYTHKHGESTFTLFYQNYILPTKFGYDKRRPHLSALVASGQMSRQEAVRLLQKPLIKGPDLRTLYEFVTKKLGFDRDEFEQYLAAPPRSHYDFPSDRSYYFKYRRLVAGGGKISRLLFWPFIR